MKNQKSKLKIKVWFFVFCVFSFTFLIASCGSIPNLQSPECAESSGIIREFYSYHFGNDMKFSRDNLKLREKFLSPELIKSLENLQTENDVFTTNETDYPKAFRVGGCKMIEPAKTQVEVLLFWKTEERSEQKSINVEAVKQGDKWLVNKILR